MIGEYGKGGIEMLAASGDLINDTMDIVSDIIMDAGYFMNAIATGVETGEPIEKTGIAVQKLLVDLVGALASIAGSLVVGGAKAGEVMAKVATEATQLRVPKTEVPIYGAMGGITLPSVTIPMPGIPTFVPLPVSDAVRKGAAEGIVIGEKLAKAVEYATGKGMLLKAV